MLLLCAAARGQNHELRPLTGKNVVGTLTQITSTEVVMTDKDGGKVVTPLAKVLAVQLGKPRNLEQVNHSKVMLLDDTVLSVKSYKIKEKKIELTLLSGVPLVLPLNTVTGLHREGESQTLAKKWQDIARQKVKTDRIVIQRDGELNPLEGVIGDADEQGEKINFKRDGGAVIAVAIEKLHGLLFYRPEGVTENPVCRIFDREGSSFLATKVSLEGDELAATTVFGAAIKLKRDTLSLLDFNMGKLTYLSDMQPLRTVERSAIGLIVKYQRDTNLDGDPILLAGQTYDKGLSMHAYTELEYNLGGQFKDLKGVLGVDPRTGAESQALVTIYCDGEKQFQETITVKEVRPISVNVKDVQKLRIVVGSRDFTNLHDHVTFAGARVSQ
jgi:hypothetical protein